MNGFKRLRGNRLRQAPAQRNAQAHKDGPQRQAPAALVRLEEKVKPGAQSQQRQHQPTRGAHARDLQQITPGPAIDAPPSGRGLAGWGQPTGNAGLHRDSKHQASQQGAQIAIARQDQQAAGAAARQNHARPKQQTPQHRARHAASGANVAGVRRLEPAHPHQRLHAHQRCAKSQPPHAETVARLTFAALHHGRTGTKPGALGRQAKEEAHQRTRHGQYIRVSPSFEQACEIHGFLQ